MVLPEIIITVHPNGNDRWIFDYRVTFEFADPDDFAEKSVFYTTTPAASSWTRTTTSTSVSTRVPSFPRGGGADGAAAGEPDPR